MSKKEQKEHLKDLMKQSGFKDKESLEKSADEYFERGQDNLGRTGEDSSNSDPNDSCGGGDGSNNN